MFKSIISSVIRKAKSIITSWMEDNESGRKSIIRLFEGGRTEHDFINELGTTSLDSEIINEIKQNFLMNALDVRCERGLNAIKDGRPYCEEFSFILYDCSELLEMDVLEGEEKQRINTLWNHAEKVLSVDIFGPHPDDVLYECSPNIKNHHLLSVFKSAFLN